MKQFARGLFTIALAAFVSTTAWAQYTPGAGINNTPHDIPHIAGNPFPAVPADAQTRICIYCHAPHNTYRLTAAAGGVAGGAGPASPDDRYDYLPLWNHELADPIPAYEPYFNGLGAPSTSSPKGSQAMLNGMTINNVSLLCLSCHDGDIAVSTYGNINQLPASRSTGTVTLAGGAYVIGQNYNLQNHHPIGFTYDAAMVTADPELRDPTTTDMVTVNGNTTTVDDHLFAGTMQCATCHSVHNTGNCGEVLLWRSDANSDLCLTCHDKGTQPAVQTCTP